MNFWPTSNWQRALVKKAARADDFDVRITELPVVPIRAGESHKVRLLPPRFVNERFLALTLVEHSWPPLDYNKLTVRVPCPRRSDPEILGASEPAPCPACSVGVEIRVSALLYAAALSNGHGAQMIKIPEWKAVPELAALGAFEFASGCGVELSRDRWGRFRFESLGPCPVTEEDYSISIGPDGLHLAPRKLPPGILQEMAAALNGFLRAGKPQPVPDQHRELMEHLPNCTLVPISFGFKGPHLPGWNKVSLEEIRDYDYRLLLDAGNIGLLCGWNGVAIIVGLDADDEALRGELLRCNPWLRTTFAVEGRPGRMKWFFEVTGPTAEKCLRSTKIFYRSVTGKEIECGDWLASGRQGVVWGLHPSGIWYRPNWMPLVSIDAREFVLPPGYSMQVKQEKSLDSAKEQYRRAKCGERAAASRELIESALSHIDPDDRGTWFKVGCALKHNGQITGDLDAARVIFDEWSKQSRKFDLGGQQKLWDSVGENGPDTITLGTLFHLAKENGWENENETED